MLRKNSNKFIEFSSKNKMLRKGISKDMLTTSINELILNKINNNKIYDLLGRELNEIPVGTMYIRNNKLYINE